MCFLWFFVRPFLFVFTSDNLMLLEHKRTYHTLNEKLKMILISMSEQISDQVVCVNQANEQEPDETKQAFFNLGMLAAFEIAEQLITDNLEDLEKQL